MKKHFLKLSVWCGLLSLFLSIPVPLTDLKIDFGLTTPISNLFIVLSAASYTLFTLGFVYLGKISKNAILILSSLLLIFVSTSSDVMLFLSQSDMSWETLYNTLAVTIVSAVAFGFSLMFHGYSLIKLKHIYGSLAEYTGWIEVISGLTLATLILSPIGLLLLIPMYICQIRLLLYARKQAI